MLKALFLKRRYGTGYFNKFLGLNCIFRVLKIVFFFHVA